NVSQGAAPASPASRETTSPASDDGEAGTLPPSTGTLACWTSRASPHASAPRATRPTARRKAMRGDIRAPCADMGGNGGPPSPVVLSSAVASSFYPKDGRARGDDAVPVGYAQAPDASPHRHRARRRRHRPRLQRGDRG